MSIEHGFPLLPLTGIGSVPHKNISDAVEFSMKFEIPFLPQMTSMSEFMVGQAFSGQSLALDLFSQKINHFKNPLFKIQIAGPVTTNLEINRLYQNILKTSQYFYTKPLVFIDEPSPKAISKDLKILILKLSTNGFKVGIHCCSHNNLQDYLFLDIDYLSLDANHLPQIEHSPQLLEFFKKKSKIVLGIIPTEEDYSQQLLFRKYQSFIKKYLPYLMLSPACGLAAMNLEQTNHCLNTLENLRQGFIN